jgi:predicted CoA-substrate-specific enzyme activase
MLIKEKNVVSCGIDIGSTSIEVVLYDGTVVGHAVTLTGVYPNKNAKETLENLLQKLSFIPQDIKYTVVTGYGRHYYKDADLATSEIICHAIGVHHYFPETCTIIDIGGQDSKFIQTDGRGKVINFVMNDRCAAGTGKFIEMTANILNISLEEISAVALRASDIYEITSMCAVFAESEIIGLIHQGIPLEAILKGVFQAIARRVLNMGRNINYSTKDIVLTGGVAKNLGVVAALTETGYSIVVPPFPEITGALGAAIIGFNGMLRTSGELQQV